MPFLIATISGVVLIVWRRVVSLAPMTYQAITRTVSHLVAR